MGTKGTSNLITYTKGLNILVICGKVIEFVCYEGKFYFDKEISKFNYESELQKNGVVGKVQNPNIF